MRKLFWIFRRTSSNGSEAHSRTPLISDLQSSGNKWNISKDTPQKLRLCLVLIIAIILKKGKKKNSLIDFICQWKVESMIIYLTLECA